MKISVIIPIYNVEDYLEESINSVLNQSYKKMEIILVNDGSTDASGEICKKYSQKYPNIKHIDQINRGLSAARNLAIKNSTGTYLVFLDSDDYWGKDFLVSMVEVIKEDKEIDYIFFKFKYYYGQKDCWEEESLNFKREDISKKTGEIGLKEILKTDKFFQWIACRGFVRREFLIENNLYFQEDRYYEDVLWTPKVFLKAKKIDYYQDAIYVYRLERQGQITSSFNYKNLEDSIYASNYWDSELDNCKLDKELKKLLMENLAIRYYFAIWFAGFIDPRDKKVLIKKLILSKDLLKYRSNFTTYITSILCKTIGFTATSIIFKYMILLKRNLKKIRK